MENQFHKDANAVTCRDPEEVGYVGMFFLFGNLPGEVKLVENGCFFKREKLNQKQVIYYELNVLISIVVIFEHIVGGLQI